MPTILRSGALRFFFYSLENAEPPHVHVESRDATAKYWLEPVELARSRGFRATELTRLRARDNYRQQRRHALTQQER
jgi:hypothetical protein